MVSANTLSKKLLNVKSAVIENVFFFKDSDDVNHIKIYARHNKWHKDACPFCHKSCKCYDSKCNEPRKWRALDWGATLVDIFYKTHRVVCPAIPSSLATLDIDSLLGGNNLRRSDSFSSGL